MYDVDHPAYKKLQEIGREITMRVKPEAVVVVSAHWQAGKNQVQINTSEKTELIYDHYYEERYPNVGSKELAEKTMSLLKKAGIEVKGVDRGLDHGVWVIFKCAYGLEAFAPDENPLDVPIVQLSLFNSDDPDQHYRLGQALSTLRAEKVQIIVSGMAVHNLRDFRFGSNVPDPMPYAISFDEALKDAATAPPAERQVKLADLLKREDARKAHPSFEHLLPIHVGAGAAGVDAGTRLFTLVEGSLSWAQYRFGDVL
ncbi:hypothetical protein GP486_003599 [Trichoglossum hirsutum]|uniref:Extradiol ring-cleavage dioxygenase class III enzyme subunit B domain-containing protein n=1 Tax=Trichoglossum hirsutum TaxID=265104 RepID=A0A9P8LCM0_9PEZI|nr:hypothetical protein GP486_003599 [Trichoglossum hirsutum]